MRGSYLISPVPIMNALEKRPIEIETVEKMIEGVEEKVRQLGKRR